MEKAAEHERTARAYEAGGSPMDLHHAKLARERAAEARRNAAAPDLDAIETDVETEYGVERGIDLGSILGHAPMVRGGQVNCEPEDRSQFRAELAGHVAVTPGWEIHCHSMVNGGEWVRRYYMARRVNQGTS